MVVMKVVCLQTQKKRYSPTELGRFSSVAVLVAEVVVDVVIVVYVVIVVAVVVDVVVVQQ